MPFNPLVIKNDKESLITEWIDGKQLNPSTLTNEQLKIIGKNLIMLHNSKLSFPKENQLSRRFKIYLQKISSLNKKVPTINKYYNQKYVFKVDFPQTIPYPINITYWNAMKRRVNNKPL